MNIFILDNDKEKCAQYHCDKHVVKQLLEYVQLLNSTYYFTNEEHKASYKLAHKNHPCTKWTRESLDNWLYLRDLALELYIEYQHRYGKEHKSGELLLTLEDPNLPSKGLTPFALAMPDEYRCSDSVRSYRDYYNGDKQHLFNWKNRKMPDWIKISA